MRGILGERTSINIDNQIFKIKGVKALVVDDNEVNILVVSTMLEQFDIIVDSAVSGKASIEKVKEKDYDIIFMDYLMPEMDGIEATQTIRDLGKVKRPAIIALTANITDEIKRKFTGAGADDIMTKPMALDAISDSLKKWITYEKLEGVSQTTITVEKEDAYIKDDKLSELKEVLEQVEELDVELGLSHLANQMDNYIKVLKATFENIQLAVKRLQQLNASQALVSSMKIEFHSLKGVLINIGAVSLSEQSHLLELAAGNQDEEYVKGKIQSYLDTISKFAMKLQSALKKYGVKEYKEDTYIPMEEEDYAMFMDDLIYYLKRFEFNELQSLSEQLFLASYGNQREKMKLVMKEIQNFRYEEALELLQK